MEETSGGADIAAWEFFGPGRVAELDMGNGLIMSHLNNDRTRSAIQSGQSTPTWGDISSDRLGYDGAGRPITKRYLAGGINGTSHAYENTTSIVGFTTVYDRSSNKFYERHLHAESRSHLYQPYADGAPTGGYDSIDRLRQYQRGELSSTSGFSNAGGGSISTPISLPGTDEFRTYDLDGLGNWRKTSFEPVGDSEQTELRQHNGLNQITRTDDGTDVDNFSYDGVPGASNGNLANDGTRSYEWDALNRLIKVYKTPDTPVLIGEYVYDGLNRRIRKTVSNGGLSGTIPNGVTDFFYNPGWQCVEERDDENDPTKQYVWGSYIDELLQQKTFVVINGNAAGNYYPLSDLLYRTTALTDSSGDIVEAYDCDAYGNTLIFTAAGTGSNWWADDAVTGDNPTCEFIFTGRRFDSEREVYYYRMRYYAPELGRFSSRDPIGYADGNNMYTYLGSAPLVRLDPSGLLAKEVTKYYSRWKDKKKWGAVFGNDYEVAFHKVTVYIRAQKCAEDCNAFASIDIRFATTRPFKFGTPLTANIAQSGLFLRDSYKQVHLLKDPTPDKTGGEEYVVLWRDAWIIDCNSDKTNKHVFLYTQRLEGKEIEFQATHYVGTITSKLNKCGKDIDLDFNLRMVDSEVAASDGKHLDEFKGPDDPDRPPYK